MSTIPTTNEEPEFIIKFKFNEDLPFGYNITFTPSTLLDSTSHMDTINTEALEFVNNYDKSKGMTYMLNELHHIASVFGTQLNLKLNNRLKLDEYEYNNSVMMFCLAVFILSQLKAVDCKNSGMEISDNLVLHLIDKNKSKEYIHL